MQEAPFKNQLAMDREQNLSTIHELADLSSIDYDRTRTDSAEKMGIRVSTLDTEVGKLRKTENSSDGVFEEIFPWEDVVDGASLLNEIRRIVTEHLIMPPPSIIACTLWIVLTYCFNQFRILPLLGVSSPEKRCGKTTLSEVLQGFILNPVLAQT